MTNPPDQEESPIAEPAPSTVAHGVLDAFFTELATMEGFNNIAGRLKKTVLTDKTFAEKAILAAIFGGSTTT